MRVIIAPLILTLGVAVVTGCSSNSSATISSIVGEWSCHKGDNPSSRVIYTDDGQGMFPSPGDTNGNSLFDRADRRLFFHYELSGHEIAIRPYSMEVILSPEDYGQISTLLGTGNFQLIATGTVRSTGAVDDVVFSTVVINGDQMTFRQTRDLKNGVEQELSDVMKAPETCTRTNRSTSATAKVSQSVAPTFPAAPAPYTAPQASDVAAPAPHSSPPAQQRAWGLVATVNGIPISRAMFEYYAKNTSGKPATELTAEQRGQLLDNLIRGELIAQESVKQGLDNTGDTASLLALSRLQILQQAGSTHYLEDKTPTDAELKAEYDAQVAGMPKTQYHARHILVASQDAAQKIIDELTKGAKFEDLAKKESSDSSKDQGGDLGWFSPSSMAPPFVNAVVALKKGEFTQTPVQTQYGWHVILLLDTRDTPVPPFDQIKDRVTQIVGQKKFRAYEDDLMKTAKIDKMAYAGAPTSSGGAVALVTPAKPGQ
jgi:peptidyl-prolyl cis-trans isomerase C